MQFIQNYSLIILLIQKFKQTQNIIKAMQDVSTCSILKIITPFQFIIQDATDASIHKIQVKPSNNKNYEHLFASIYGKKLEYTLEKKNNNKIREQFKKGSLFLGKKQITSCYTNTHIKQYMSSQVHPDSVLQCFVSKVECLKLELINLANLKYITFYFSQLKLIRLGNIHPKQMWERAQNYFKQELQGEFIELTVTGLENYKQEVNIFGQIKRRRDGIIIEQKIIGDGYGELSKNPQKYLSKQKIQMYNRLRDQAKIKNKGMWQTSKNINKSNLQVQQFKYKQWEEWIKQGRKIGSIRNEEEQLKNICEQLVKICQAQSKLEYNKIKVLLDAICTLFQNSLGKKYFRFFEQIIKTLCNLLNNLYISIYQHIDSIDFIKSINKILIFLSFYHVQLENYIEINKGQKIIKIGEVDFQKAIKLIFKLCFLGNQTFHDKIFGKKKQHNYENFNFESAYLQGGFSSMSECSDYEQGDKLTKQQKRQRKINSAHQKIRINATNLLSYLFKHYGKITQTYWQMCVTSNIISMQFLTHVKSLKLTVSQVKMNQQIRKEIVNLMRSNFGDHSLILLSIFERNSKVRINSINCLLNMIANFEGKKLIAAAERAYVEKLLKSTKSSFVPKSFIIFSGLRNALYFLLFALYYEKNLQIIVMIFKTLCELCNNCNLIDKMSFQEGMGLLMSNYIMPVLEFQWSIVELQELKMLCINFLSVLVSNNRRWIQIQEKYFKSDTLNVNHKLLHVIQIRKGNNKVLNEDKLVNEILNYFTKLSKKYFGIIFYKIKGEQSIWNTLQTNFIERINHNYSQFVEEIFKGYLDELQAINSQNVRNKQQSSISQDALAQFLLKFIKSYAEQITPNNYLRILSTLTYIDYNYWSDPSFIFAKQFILHCFYSFVDDKYQLGSKQFASISSIKTNTLIRISLIKLVGYMSFCPEFQTDQIVSKSVKILLQLSKQYKSFNSVVKVTWGLSNWAKTIVFSRALKEKQLKECLDYMMKHSESDKQKIASNCTRGIGFFVANIPKKIDLKDCRRHIIKNMTHNIIKVRTNSTKTLITLASDLTEDEIKDIISVLQQNMLKNNFHLQMETLNLMKRLDYPIKGSRLLKLLVNTLKNLLNYTTIQYEFSEIKTIKQLRYTVLSQIFNNPSQINKNLDLAKDILISVYAYLTRDCKQQQDKPENTKAIQKQFEKTQEAREFIFNKGKESYNEQKIITTELISKGFVFKASHDDFNLIKKIVEFGSNEGSVISEEWQNLSKLRMDGNSIMIDFSALQLGDIYEEAKQFLEV